MAVGVWNARMQEWKVGWPKPDGEFVQNVLYNANIITC